ncbi:DUF4145 domain-containing protein [Vibrio fluvialis]|nr:DUF4145 domain-containing protein [Vibrio fluvialis]
MLDENLWLKIVKFTPTSSYPKLPCPYCGSQNLQIKSDDFQFKELSLKAIDSYLDRFDNTSKPNFYNDDHAILKIIGAFAWGFDRITHSLYQCAGFFQCSICNEHVSAIGVIKRHNERQVSDQIKIETFNPPVPVFPLQNTTPNTINEELLGSFSYFHSDACSSGNKLRRAIERLCKELGYGKSLHRNLQDMEKDYPQEAKWLNSLKLLGNEATHSDNIDEKDLLMGYKVLEVVLDIFRRKIIDPQIENAVNQLNQKFNKPQLLENKSKASYL